MEKPPVSMAWLVAKSIDRAVAKLLEIRALKQCVQGEADDRPGQHVKRRKQGGGLLEVAVKR